MNAIVIEHPARIKAEIDAFAHAAHKFSRLSVQYENWAKEAERQGKADAANRWANESVRLRVSASWHLTKAMERKDRRYA